MTIPDHERFYRPNQQPLASQGPLEDRKERFAALLAFIAKRNGFVTSRAGELELRFETLEESNLADELRKLGYRVLKTGFGERILAHQIVERLVRASDGSLVLATVGSTLPIASTVTHAGVCRTRRFAFDVPAATDAGMRIAP